ncbi:MAG: chemotaxis-specific protein-glutamate methyltransferase CheB [Oligoflexia bacterium]|nr:chemotaxis-specific protein-glutamate methyltransferase CheB [Oligoflexia bacterium]
MLPIIIAHYLILRKMIESNSKSNSQFAFELKVIAEASNPIEAMEIQKRIKPDVITLDLNMPKMDGLTYLRQYMVTNPVPTIIITDYNHNDTRPMFEALEVGAFDYIKKPSFADMEKLLDEKSSSEKPLNDLSEKIISAFCNSKKLKNRLSMMLRNNSNCNTSNGSNLTILSDQHLIIHLWSIGASTGGTEAIQNILISLPAKIPPILIVIHMPPVFTNAFAERLNELCKFKVKEASNDDIIEESTVYIAPGDRQMKVLEEGRKIKIKINQDPVLNRFRPSVDYLFNSLQSIKHRKIVATLLTGMGDDGARGLLNLKKLGVTTIAQDETTCIVFGMPKVAIQMGGVVYIEKLLDISARMIQVTKTM